MRYSRSGTQVNLSECYNGGDEFMRVIMRVGTQFEEWACRHIAFEALDDVWPYLLEDKFGEACVALRGATSLDEFDESDCLEVSLRLRLPVKVSDSLPVPIDISAVNPIAGSEFRKFRIQTLRKCNKMNIVLFTIADAPFDERFERPFFGLYGIYEDGLLEHIADFDTYAAVVSLVRKLAPGIRFADIPYSG
ncbi:hypothetical protein BH11VER1_BH11VER1_23060 [soil metagenome]